ncbi:MAG: hypothetical protein ACK5LC_16325 [Coprobacillaceae bacterium]
MKFIRKHRFKFIISFLVVVLVIVSFYRLWVHVPYTRNQNRLDNIRNEIVSTNDYKYEDYFNEYNSDQTYYILYVEKEDKKQYVVYDYQKEYITSYSGEIVSEQNVRESFQEKYEKAPTSVEIGFENDKFVYCIKYKEDNTLIFAFYGIDNGVFIKSYRL